MSEIELTAQLLHVFGPGIMIFIAFKTSGYCGSVKRKGLLATNIHCVSGTLFFSFSAP